MTKNPAMTPAEYPEFVLCKLLHCLPSQLEDEDAEKMQLFLAFHEAEVKARDAQQQIAAGQARSKGKK